MKKNYYAKALALTVAASMVSVPAFAAEGTDDPQAQEETVEQDEQKGEKSAEEDEIGAYSDAEKKEQGIANFTNDDMMKSADYASETAIAEAKETYGQKENENFWYAGADSATDAVYAYLDEDTLKIVGEGKMCSSFDTVYVEGTTKVMDQYGENVKKIIIENGVTYLAANLTRNTKNAEVEIPTSVTEMNIATTPDDSYSTLGNNYYSYNEESGEAEVYGIGKITVDDNNPSFKMKDGVLFSKDGKTLYRYTSEAAENYVVPDEVTNVAAKAFSRSGNLMGVTLNEGITIIGQDCFDKSHNLSGSIVIPSTVQSMGAAAFTQLPNLKEMTFAANDLSGYGYISNSTLPITGIQKVTFAEGTKELPNNLCQQLEQLKTVIVPESLEKLNKGVFGGCKSLEYISLTKNTALTEIGDSVFSSSSLKSIIIPDSVTKIGDSAFWDNTQLESIKISPDSRLESLGQNAICSTAITSLYLPKGAATWGQYTFGGNRALVAVDLTALKNAVPQGGKAAFWNTKHGGSEDTYATRVYYLSNGSDDLKKALGSNSNYSIYAVTNGGTFKTVPNSNTELAEPQKSGYTFGGWYNNAKCTGDAVTTLEKSKTYYAKWTLDQPVIKVDGTETKVYDGKDVTLSVSTEDASYQWYKVEGETKTEVGTERTLTLKDVADSGSYVCEVTANGETKTSNSVAVSITKATPIITISPSVTAQRGAGAVTLTVTKPKTATGDVAVKCDNGITVGKKDGVYTAVLPNATRTYTFTASYAGDSNYNAVENVTCTVDVTRKKSGSSSSSDTSAPTYGVSTGKTENGEISVTPAKAEAGETVTIKATPDSGYQLDKMTVKDKNNSTVKLKKVDDNEYTFTMPVGKVSVDATFVQKDAADDSNAAEAGKTIKLQIGSRIVNVDNEAVIYDAAPVIRNDRTLVPIRIITEALGGKVDWNGATKEVTLSINDKEIKMTIGKTLEKYGVAPVIIDGRTFVPVRFVADELGANVAWDDATKTVTIKTAR